MFPSPPNASALSGDLLGRPADVQIVNLGVGVPELSGQVDDRIARPSADNEGPEPLADVCRPAKQW